MLTKFTKRGGLVVKKSPKLVDVVCEQPLLVVFLIDILINPSIPLILTPNMVARQEKNLQEFPDFMYRNTAYAI